MSQAATKHPVWELLGRYAAIVAAAWAQRKALDGPMRSADEAAFLPAALSLQDTPPHPLPRRLAWLLMALFLIALAWSFFGKIDIVAVAPGRIVVSERTKVIQPLEASVVRRVLVKDGDHVQAGQVLVELDPTMAEADRSSVREQYLAALSEELRTQALRQALDGGALATPRSGEPDLPEGMLGQQLQAEWMDIASKRGKLQAEIERKRAELATARELLAKLEATLPLSRRREADYQTLVDQGFISGHATQDRTRERIEQERDLATQRAKVAESLAGLAESSQALVAYLAEVRRNLHERQQLSSTKRAQLQAEGLKAAQRERLTQLSAPLAGVVQQLAIHSVGGVVTSAQPLMVIVPDTEEVTALVQVANLDIGFVNQGQDAEIKLETFPYTKYGTVPARITVLGADAVTDEKTGISTYPATLTLERRHMQVEGKTVPISPGMNVSAEIKTGHRRVIEFLLSPIVRAGGESLRER
jgi:hemolysin D